jgi:protein TonB
MAPAFGADHPAGASSDTPSRGGEGWRGDKGKGTGKGSGFGSGGKTRTTPPPKLLSSPPPRYPSAARASRTTGRVSVLIRVRADGTASSAKLYHGSGHKELDQAAVEAARSWTFSKTPTLGPSGTVDVVVQVNFSL